MPIEFAYVEDKELTSTANQSTGEAATCGLRHATCHLWSPTRHLSGVEPMLSLTPRTVISARVLEPIKILLEPTPSA